MRAGAVGVAAALLTAFAAVGTPGAALAEETALVLAIKDGVVAPEQRVLRVFKDARVRLRVTSDRAVVLHVHGYGIEVNVAPDRAGEATFSAHATGRYPIQLHEMGGAAPAHRHGAALAHLEVRPR